MSGIRCLACFAGFALGAAERCDDFGGASLLRATGKSRGRRACRRLRARLQSTAMLCKVTAMSPKARYQFMIEPAQRDALRQIKQDSGVPKVSRSDEPSTYGSRLRASGSKRTASGLLPADAPNLVSTIMLWDFDVGASPHRDPPARIRAARSSLVLGTGAKLVLCR